MMDRASNIGALALFLRNYPLHTFSEEERQRFISFQSWVCRLEAEAFDNLGMR